MWLVVVQREKVVEFSWRKWDLSQILKIKGFGYIVKEIKRILVGGKSLRNSPGA